MGISIGSVSPLIAIIASIAAVIVSVGGLLLQYRRDKTDAISKAAQYLFPPLERRVDQLEKDKSEMKSLLDSQTEQIEHDRETIDKTQYELRVANATRNNLLQEVLNWQRKFDAIKQERDGLREELDLLKIEVAEIKAELERLKSEKEQGDFDARAFLET